MARLLLVADGSPGVGLGHVMRCVALADAARARGFEVGFHAGPVDAIGRLLMQRGYEPAVGDRARELGGLAAGDGVVFDGYDFGPDEHAMVPAGVRVGVVDDLGRGAEVDVVVDQNPRHRDYDLPARTTLLAGPTYALIRSDLMQHRGAWSAGRQRVLVTVGGADVRGDGPRLAQAAARTGLFDETHLLAGRLGAEVEVPGATVVGDRGDVAATFAATNLAVTAAGSSTLELAFLGVPMITVQTAENQVGIGPGLQAAGAALHADGPDDVPELLGLAVDLTWQRDASAAGAELVDGQGANRVLDVLFRGR